VEKMWENALRGLTDKYFWFKVSLPELSRRKIYRSSKNDRRLNRRSSYMPDTYENYENEECQDCSYFYLGKYNFSKTPPRFLHGCKDGLRRPSYPACPDFQKRSEANKKKMQEKYTQFLETFKAARVIKKYHSDGG